MKKIIFLLITCAVVCACKKGEKQQEQQNENSTQEVFVPDTAFVREVVSEEII